MANRSFWQSLDMVGSDIDNFGCPYCWSHDRERHLFMFFDRLQLWNKIEKGAVLHFAPETHVAAKIQSLLPSQYVKADLFPTTDDIRAIDATHIPFEENWFDMVICNHVLEHIPSYEQALAEIYRVLKPNGIAILQTPYSKLLEHNFEDQNVNTNESRLAIFGQEDHVRIFSEKRFFASIQEAGFKLTPVLSSQYFDQKSAIYYGFNRKEDLIYAVKQ
ncbi:MAG: class I SAM-dependent methyltransferase [Bacteroidales bacterium]